MPHRIKLDDRSAWDALRPGQYVVFLSDAHTDVVLDSDGRVAGEAMSVPVFECVADAETYAGQIVLSLPHVCAAIYDHHGRACDPLRRVYHESIRHRFDPERRARIYAWTGGSLLATFTIWAFIAAHKSDEHFLWFYIVGMKLLVLGTVLFVRGMSHIWAEKRTNR